MTKFKPSFDPNKLVGKRFGRLIVVKYSHKKVEPKRITYFWECLCDCGNTTFVRTGHLNSGCVVSCGCYRKYINKNKGHTKEDILNLVNEIQPSENGCKIWTHTLNDKGYGKISFKNKTCEVHRVLYRCVHGEIKRGLVVRHLCNNRACVNIDHLALGTQKDNAQDAVKAGMYNIGEKHHAAKLTEEQIIYIRKNEMHIGTSALGRKYGVSYQTIEQVKKRHTWTHI